MCEEVFSIDYYKEYYMQAPDGVKAEANRYIAEKRKLRREIRALKDTRSALERKEWEVDESLHRLFGLPFPSDFNI